MGGVKDDVWLMTEEGRGPHEDVGRGEGEGQGELAGEE